MHVEEMPLSWVLVYVCNLHICVLRCIEKFRELERYLVQESIAKNTDIAAF